MKPKRLKERLGLAQPEPAVDEIDLKIPDPTADLVKGAAAVAATVQGLVDEQNDMRRKNEWLMRELVVVKNMCTRIEAERDYWRRQAIEYVRANGELASTIGGMLKLAESAQASLLKAQLIADEMPVGQSAFQSAATQETPAYDGNGLPITRPTNGSDVPPPIDAEQIKELAAKLATCPEAS